MHMAVKSAQDHPEFGARWFWQLAMEIQIILEFVVETLTCYGKRKNSEYYL